MTNRRTFLKNSVAGGLVAILAPGPILGSVTLDKEAPIPTGQKQLEQLLGTHFMVIEEDGRLTRLELTSLLNNPVDPRLEQFYLYFTHTEVGNLEERSYHMHHPSLGDQHLFLQPLDQNSIGPHYRATFSLLIDPQLAAG